VTKEKYKTPTLEQLHEKRKQVIALHLQAIGVMQIVAMTGLSYPAVRACIQLFEAGGWPALQPALRGRSPGQGRVLTPTQEASLQHILATQRPEQLNLRFSQWSQAAVGQLIVQQYGITLHDRSVGKYFKRWGFKPA
jgi:transposase